MNKEESSNNGTNKSIGRAREINALITSNNIKDAARKAGVSVRTLHRRLEDEEFRDLLTKTETRILETTVARMVKMMGQALDKLEDLLKRDDVSPSVQLGLVRTVLDYNIKLRELRNFEQRLMVVEEALKEMEP